MFMMLPVFAVGLALIVGLVASAITKRWIVFIVLLIIPLLLGSGALMAVMRPESLQEEVFPDGGRLFVSYSKTQGIVKSFYGAGDLTYRIENGDVSTSGTLLTGLPHMAAVDLVYIKTGGSSITLQDDYSGTRWTFTNSGEMKPLGRFPSTKNSPSFLTPLSP